MFSRGLRTVNLRSVGSFASVPKYATAFSLCKSSNFHDASRLYGTFSEKPRLDLSQIKEFDDAVALFKEMLVMRPRPSGKNFVSVISTVVRMKRYADALVMFDEMRQSGHPVDVYHLTIAINCFCRLHKVNYGFSVLGIMFKLGCRPDVFTFSCEIKDIVSAANVVELSWWSHDVNYWSS